MMWKIGKSQEEMCYEHITKRCKSQDSEVLYEFLCDNSVLVCNCKAKYNSYVP